MRTRSFRLVLGLFGLLVLVGGAGTAGADTTAQSVPFTQDWSNTGLYRRRHEWTTLVFWALDCVGLRPG